jgi:hypothetical protein
VGRIAARVYALVASALESVQREIQIRQVSRCIGALAL